MQVPKKRGRVSDKFAPHVATGYFMQNTILFLIRIRAFLVYRILLISILIISKLIQ